jgi:hypothetical protein
MTSSNPEFSSYRKKNSKWPQILYEVLLEPSNLVYKIWEFYKFIWPEIPFRYESDLLRQVLIPTLVTIEKKILKWAQILYGVQLGILEPVYKIWELYELVCSKFSLIFVCDILKKMTFRLLFFLLFMLLIYSEIVKK